jgi:hypothetical protein
MQSVALRPREARRKSPPALRTLVLNADYRPLSTYPLSIIAAHDAVSAIWSERVDVVEAWPDAFFRSPSTTIAVVPLPGRRYRHHVDSHGIRTVQSAILCRPAPFSRMLYVPVEPADPATPSSF